MPRGERIERPRINRPGRPGNAIRRIKHRARVAAGRWRGQALSLATLPREASTV
jgi:hypothetical protein